MPYKSKEIQKAYLHQYYLGHKKKYVKESEECLKRKMERNRHNRMKIKIEVLGYYCGNDTPFCIHCGENDIRTLVIDHINGGGSTHRKSLNIHGGWRFYYWLRKNHYPLGFQVLCMNCNTHKKFDELGFYTGGQDGAK